MVEVNILNKLKMKMLILLVLFCVVTLNSCKKIDEAKNTQMDHSMPMKNELMQSMSKTNETMNNAIINGDFDFDFVNLMIMHHQMALDMSRVEISKGSDQIIKNMAKEIVSAQELEIKEMQQFLKNYKIPERKNQISNSYKIDNEMKLMMKNMNAIKMTENIDKDYVAMMIPHHESAVNMAKQQLQFGKQEILLKLSKKIIKAQNNEIDEFRKWQIEN